VQILDAEHDKLRDWLKTIGDLQSDDIARAIKIYDAFGPTHREKGGSNLFIIIYEILSAPIGGLIFDNKEHISVRMKAKQNTSKREGKITTAINKLKAILEEMNDDYNSLSVSNQRHELPKSSETLSGLQKLACNMLTMNQETFKRINLPKPISPIRFAVEEVTQCVTDRSSLPVSQANGNSRPPMLRVCIAALEHKYQVSDIEREYQQLADRVRKGKS
jgi:hypothetical protein